MANDNKEPFEGFPKDLPDFLWGIAFHNEKPWFEAHREDYERCLHGPVKSLVREVLEGLEERFPDLTLRPHISRIYRDARTLNGRGPLNDHMWFSIGRTGRVYAVEPQFYFGIEARCTDWGIGYWHAGTDMLERWRARIDADPKKLSSIVRGIQKLDGFSFLGETYKRPKGDPGKLLFDWYNGRQLGVGKTVWFDPDPPGKEMAETLIRDFSALMPLYEYFLEL